MLTLLLLGRSGNGTSSVGNSILGSEKALKRRGPSEEMRLTHEICRNKDYVVVDCSVIGDTGFGNRADVTSEIRSALWADAPGGSENNKGEDASATKAESDGGQQLIEFDDEEDDLVRVEMTVLPNGAPLTDSTAPSSKTKDLPNGVEIADTLFTGRTTTSNRNTSETRTPKDTDGGDIEVECAKDISAKVCGFDALIFVMKYGVRFTKQEKDAVQMVKSIFGENVFRDWGILVFSYGDNFYLDTKDDKITFEDWCQEQTGDIKLLFEEVKNKCVIFDNKSTKKDKELENLKGYIGKVTKDGRPYTLADFDNAKRERVKLQLNHSYGGLQAETDHLLIKANQLIEQLPPDREHLQKLLDDLLQLVEQIITLDEGTGVLTPLLEHVNEQIASLEAKMKQLESSQDVRSYAETAWQYVVSWFWQTFERIRSAIARGIARVSPAPDPTTRTDDTMLFS